MVMRDLPFLQTRHSRTHIDAAGNVGRGAYSNGSKGVNQGERGAAHVRPRDAYRDVPILVKPPWGHDRAIAFKFALAPQCSALNKNDAAHPVEHLAIGPFDPPTAILRVTGTQCMMRYCRTTSWIWASQCHNYDIVMS